MVRQMSDSIDFDISSFAIYNYFDIPYFRGLAPRGACRFSKFFGGALNRSGALIKTYENLDLTFPAHTRTL